MAARSRRQVAALCQAHLWDRGGDGDGDRDRDRGRGLHGHRTLGVRTLDARLAHPGDETRQGDVILPRRPVGQTRDVSVTLTDNREPRLLGKNTSTVAISP